MMTGAFEGGDLYILTSVPHIPATSIFFKALSSRMSGIGNSGMSVVLGPTLTAARTFSIELFPPPRARIHHENQDYGQGDHSCASRDEAQRTEDRWCCGVGLPDCADCRSRVRGDCYSWGLGWRQPLGPRKSHGDHVGRIDGRLEGRSEWSEGAI